MTNIFCRKRNKLVDAMRDMNFCPLTLPNSTVSTLIIVEKDGNEYRRTSSIESLFDYDPKTNPFPVAKSGNLPQKISQQTTTKVDAQVGITLVQNWLSSLLGASLQFGTDSNAISTIEIEFLNTEEERVQESDLNAFLELSSIAGTTTTYQNKIKNNELYVITSVLKSNAFTIKAFDKAKNGVNFGIDLPQVVDGKLKVGNDSSNQTLMKYADTEMLTFGVQCCQIFYDNGNYRLKPAANAMVKGKDEPIRPNYLQIEQVFLELQG